MQPASLLHLVSISYTGFDEGVNNLHFSGYILQYSSLVIGGNGEVGAGLTGLLIKQYLS